MSESAPFESAPSESAPSESGPREPVDRRNFLTLSLGAGAAAVLAACSGGGKTTAPTTTASSTTSTTVATTTTRPPVVAPLTGLAYKADPARLRRPALVVKIDNADSGESARPQTGLDVADVVFEEMVEGSVTRFAAVFHSQDSDPVGPIRSGRDTDIEILSALNHPLFAWSGGNAQVVADLRRSPLSDLGYDVVPSAYFRSGTKRAPHNLYSSTSQLFAKAPAGAKPPTPLFAYRPLRAPAPAKAPIVQSARIVFGGGAASAPVGWQWDPATGAFLRSQRGTPHVAASGRRIAAANVVIQYTSYFRNGQTDIVGTPVYQAQLVGTGVCDILTAGRRVRGTWAKASATRPTVYKDAAGAVIGLTPGITWVELVQSGGTSFQ